MCGNNSIENKKEMSQEDKNNKEYPESVKFCHKLGMDYVSCSPFRVPIARLAAAQAAVEMPRQNKE